MRADLASAGTLVVGRPEVQGSTVLRGPRLVAARVAWTALVALELGLFAAAIPALYLRRSAIPAEVQTGLAQLGLSADIYAAYWAALHLVFGLGHFAVAALIARRKSDEGIALLVSLFLVLIGAANAATTDALVWRYPATALPVGLSFVLTCAALILVLFLFPDGRFVPRRLRLPVLIVLAALPFALLLPAPAPDGSPPALVALLLMGGFGAGVIAQHYRYRRVATPAQRQQTKWVVFGASVAVAGHTVAIFSFGIPPALVQPGVPALVLDLANVTCIVCSFLLIPLSIGVAVLKYRLWDIDVLINRALVYGALTACVGGLYALIVFGAGALFHARGNPLVSLLAAGLVAVLFQPLRERLQRGVNRLLYGERDEPYAVLSRLGQRLEGTLAPEAVLPTIVQTVREALKLPYAAIALRQDEGVAIAVASGVPTDEALRLPLTYQHATVGELALAPRAPGEPFFPADRRLLGDLARQAGVAAHAVLLAADLERSRRRVVAAREEARRRLGSDLHDGLGHRLAALMRRAETAANLLDRDPGAAKAALADLTRQAQGAIAEVRGLAHALHPPDLELLGLVGALRERAQQCAGAGERGVRVVVEAPAALPPLPVAVEAAAYYIAQEALTNVQRHAAARHCRVRLALVDRTAEGGLALTGGPPPLLELEITDDGRGPGPDGVRSGAGLGLRSMRERAAELGGSCIVEPRPAGGTRVTARLPCTEL